MKPKPLKAVYLLKYKSHQIYICSHLQQLHCYNLFRCQICSQSDVSCSSPLFTSPASLAPSGNEVLCQRTRFDSNASIPTITARLRVVWNNRRTIDNPDNALGTLPRVALLVTRGNNYNITSRVMYHANWHDSWNTRSHDQISLCIYNIKLHLCVPFVSFPVILYSCSLMGTNCGQCLSLESRFECSYCVEGPAPPMATGSCQLEATCPTGNGFLRFGDPQDIQNCPTPVISDVSNNKLLLYKV